MEMYENIGKINSWANSRLRNCLKGQTDEFFSTVTPYGLLGDIIALEFEAINLWINRIEIKHPSAYIRRLDDFEDISHLFSEWQKLHRSISATLTLTYIRKWQKQAAC